MNGVPAPQAKPEKIVLPTITVFLEKTLNAKDLKALRPTGKKALEETPIITFPPTKEGVQKALKALNKHLKLLPIRGVFGRVEIEFDINPKTGLVNKLIVRPDVNFKTTGGMTYEKAVSWIGKGLAEFQFTPPKGKKMGTITTKKSYNLTPSTPRKNGEPLPKEAQYARHKRVY